NVAMQQRLGIKTELVSPEDLPRLLPGVTTDDVGGAAWEPESGYADPNATAFAFAAAAVRGGARVETGREVTRVVVEGGRVAAVETRDGRVATRVVVLVPGAWARPLLEPLGLHFGLVPHRTQVVIDRIPSIDGLYVMLGDSGTSFKTSPAIGRCLAEWIVEGRPRTADLTPFRATRFAEGRPWVDEDNYGRERLTISR